MTSTPIEEVNKALGRPVWYQLYAPEWAASEQLLRRVEAAGTRSGAVDGRQHHGPQ